MKSKLIQTLSQRGFIQDCTNLTELDNLLYHSEQQGTPVPIYIGFDLTANSLHIGSLIQLMLLYHIQQCGHKPIILLGEATTKIGDPSGKTESRKLLSKSQIEVNKQGIEKIFKQFVTIDDKNDNNSVNATIVTNNSWYDNLSMFTFLQDIGKHFSINQMITNQFIKSRLDNQQHLSYLEFSYQLLQAYDFVKLSKYYDVRVQMGGSDQWANIIAGIDLYKKINNEQGKELITPQIYGLTTPLITTSDGKKMGKSESGTIWLSKELTSSKELWNYFRNINDNDIVRFIKLFSDNKLYNNLVNNYRFGEIPHISESYTTDEGKNNLKIMLADNILKRVHNETMNFNTKIIYKLDANQLNQSKRLNIVQLYYDILNCDNDGDSDKHISKSECRRLIEQKAVKVNGITVGSGFIIDKELFENNQEVVISTKKEKYLIQLTNKSKQ